MDVNPQVLQLPPRELLVLPPEKLDLWTEADKENYDIWKGEHQSIKNTEEDYRLFIIQLNKDYNIEEIYDHIETGLSALERLVEISKKFPGFDVENEIENTYAKDNMLEKDFVKSGFKLVLNYYENSGHLSQVTPTKIYTADDEKMTKTQVDSSNTQHRTPVVKEEVVEECEKTLTRNKSKNKKKRNKESRQKRLLKFHEKLVTASGLPPSRLMEKQKLKRSLVDEFEQIGGVYDPGSDARPSFMHPAQPSHNITPAPVSLPPAAPSIEAKPRVTEPGIPAAVGVVQGEGEGQWHDGTGMSSGNRIFSTLSSGLPSAGLSPGWSDARPFAQCGCGLTNYQPQGSWMSVCVKSEADVSRHYGFVHEKFGQDANPFGVVCKFVNKSGEICGKKFTTTHFLNKHKNQEGHNKSRVQKKAKVP